VNVSCTYYVGDALTVLRTLPAGSVDLVRSRLRPSWACAPTSRPTIPTRPRRRLQRTDAGVEIVPAEVRFWVPWKEVARQLAQEAMA
jgi:hypothetical protein